MFRRRLRSRRDDAAPGDAATPAVIARHEDLWLLASGPGLVLLVEAGQDRPAAHQRAAQVAENLRCELFEHLTVAPFLDTVVLVGHGVSARPGELGHGAVRHLVLPGPVPAVVGRITQLIDDGDLSLPWRRYDAAAVAG